MLTTHLIIGEIIKPQGVKGEVKIKPITYDLERFMDMRTVLFKRGDEYIEKKMRTTRIDPDAVYMMFDGIKDRNAAETLRGELLYVDRANAVQLPEDAEFICDLIGCVATDDSGRLIGTLKDVMQPGSNDVYVFTGGELGEVLVPALKSVVLNVDVVNKTMRLSREKLSEVAVFDED